MTWSLVSDVFSFSRNGPFEFPPSNTIDTIASFNEMALSYNEKTGVNGYKRTL